AKGLMKAAIRDDNPVVFFEDKMQYKLKGAVPLDDYVIPLGVAGVKRTGRDITIFATSSMMQVALGAAQLLERIGVDAEGVDPRLIVESMMKTSRAIVRDEGYGRYGVAAELAAVIAEGAFYNLDAPVTRLGAMHVPIPFSPPLEDATVPTERNVFETARRLCGREAHEDTKENEDRSPRVNRGMRRRTLWRFAPTARWASTGSSGSTSIGCAPSGSHASKPCWRSRSWAHCSAST